MNIIALSDHVAVVMGIDINIDTEKREVDGDLLCCWKTD